MSTALRVTTAARATTGEQLACDGTVHPGNAAQFARHTQTSRAVRSGVSRRTQQKLDRLAHERPDLLDRVRAGELSAHRAAIEAGIVRKPTEPEHAAVVADGSDRGYWHAVRAALDGLAGCPLPAERLVELTPTYRLVRMAASARTASRIASDLADRLEARLEACGLGRQRTGGRP